MEEIIELYCSAWSISDPHQRVVLLNSAVDGDVQYVDPTVFVTGIPALAAHIGTVISRYPGARIEVTSGVDVHHGCLRFAWKKVLANGQALPEGTDFCEIGEGGKLTKIVGFFGPLKPATMSPKRPRSYLSGGAV